MGKPIQWQGYQLTLLDYIEGLFKENGETRACGANYTMSKKFNFHAFGWARHK